MEEKYFSEEHYLLRDMVKELANNDIAKLAHEIDETGKYPMDSIKKNERIGFDGYTLG